VIFLWMLIIFSSKFMETYLVRLGTFTTFSKRGNISMILDGLDESLGLLALALLVVDLFYLPFSLSYIAGSVIATRAIAMRWPRFIWRIIRPKKKVSRKKISVTTA
jgi:hypothetical protein